MNPFDIRLTNDLLLIRRLPDEEEVTTPWGFVLPPTDENKDTPLRGLVLAAGPGRRPKMATAAKELVSAARYLLDDVIKSAGLAVQYDSKFYALSIALAAHSVLPELTPMTVKVGDTVIFSRHGFQAFRIFGEDLIVTQEASILGVIAQ